MDGHSWHSDDDLAWARAVLAKEGIPPGASGYDETALAKGIYAHGWDYSFTGVTGAWTAEVFRGAAAATQTVGSASWEDRETALLIAFATALDAEAQG